MLALPLLVAGHLQCAEASGFGRHMTKLAVVCHCGEEDLRKSLSHGQPAVRAAQRMKTGSSLSCVHDVEKGLLKAPHTCDGFAGIFVVILPKHSLPTRTVSAPCPWSCRPPALLVPIFTPSPCTLVGESLASVCSPLASDF